MKTNFVRVTLCAPLALAALVAGCGLTRPAPVKETFLLDPPAPAVVAAARPGSARIGVVTVAAPFRDRTCVVREADLRYASDFYREWVVPPSAMIAEATARSLDRAKAFTRIVPPGAAPESDYVIDAFVSALYADDRDAAMPAAAIAITFFVSRVNGGGVPVWSREYQRRTPLPRATSDAYVGAQNVALGEILSEFARDIAAATLPPR